MLSLLLSLVVAAAPTFSPADTQAPAAAATTLPTPQFRRYGSAEGLPSNSVYALAQDQAGILWIGTNGGLVRYDGVDFKVFRSNPANPDDPSGPSSDTVGRVVIDRDGRVWIGGPGAGLGRYDPGVDRFRHWFHDGKRPDSLIDDDVWSLALDAGERLWVGTRSGLERLRTDGKGFEHVVNPLAPKDGFGMVTALKAEPDGRLWIGGRGLYLRRPDGGVQEIRPQSGSFGRIWQIDGAGGDLRVATTEGLWHVEDGGVAVPAYRSELPKVGVLASRRDNHGKLWIATRHGIYLDDGRGRLYAIDGHPLLLGGLPGYFVWQVFGDREGGLWFGLDDGGLAYLAPGWDGFTRYTHIPDDAGSLHGIEAHAVAADGSGRLWVGEYGRVEQLDPVTGRVGRIIENIRGEAKALLEDRRGRLWIVGQGALYVYADGALHEVDPGHAALQTPKRLALGKDGQIFVGTEMEGVFVVDPATLAVAQLPQESRDDDALVCNQLAVRGGVLWYANDQGLMRWDVDAGRLAWVRGMPRINVDAFDFDRDGVWTVRVGRLEHYRLAADGSVALDRTVTSDKGWNNAIVTGLRVGPGGQLWLFARNGLWRYDPATGVLRAFGAADGLVDAQFVNDAGVVAADGAYYAPTLGGVVGFRPDRQDLAPGRQDMPVALTRIQVRRNGATVDLPVVDGAISLGWRDRDLRVQARMISYSNPAANRYRFRLRGFDHDWVDIGSYGEREFSGLGPGDYLLEVTAAGSDGQRGQLEAPLRVRMAAPPWLRWWAWLLYALGLVLAARLGLQGWQRRLAQRHAIQLAEQRRLLAEQASAAKTRFLATLGHEIRTPMTGVLGMAELLLKTPLTPAQREYALAMQGSGGLLLKLVNDALDLARIEAGRLELEPVAFDPVALVREIARLGAGQAQAKGLRLETRLTGALPAAVTGDVVRIRQVLLNLLGNALKFTERGTVTLALKAVAAGLEFDVGDSGPGIPEASQARLFGRFEQAEGPQRRSGSGLGLAICRELVTAMGGHIELESSAGRGSTFRVTLPLAAVPGAALTAPARPAVDAPQRLCLLLVEDDPIVAAVIRGLLEAQGHVVHHVVHGLAAVAELSQVPFDAMLLDLDLPGVDGFQIARLLRQREAAEGLPRLPVIAVTARSGGDEEEQVYAADMDGFLRKPLNGEMLARELAARLAGAAEAQATPARDLS